MNQLSQALLLMRPSCHERVTKRVFYVYLSVLLSFSGPVMDGIIMLAMQGILQTVHMDELSWSTLTELIHLEACDEADRVISTVVVPMVTCEPLVGKTAHNPCLVHIVLPWICASSLIKYPVRTGIVPATETVVIAFSVNREYTVTVSIIEWG